MIIDVDSLAKELKEHETLLQDAPLSERIVIYESLSLSLRSMADYIDEQVGYMRKRAVRSFREKLDKGQ